MLVGELRRALEEERARQAAAAAAAGGEAGGEGAAAAGGEGGAGGATPAPAAAAAAAAGIAMIKSGDLAKLYDKWFMQPIPPNNVKVGLPLSEATKAAWADPNDKPMEAYQKK